jgi:hypothetical protein
MATYPYTYLASFMNPDFQLVVVNQALRQALKRGGPAKQQIEQAARSAGVSAPGFRPGKIPLQQLARPLVTPVSRNSQVSAFTSSEEIAAPVFALWVESQPELRARVSAFLTEKGMTFSETLPEAGLEEMLPVSEMDALTKEMGAGEEGDLYDNTALMLVCLLGRAPVYEEDADAEDEDADGEAAEGLEAGEPAADQAD